MRGPSRKGEGRLGGAVTSLRWTISRKQAVPHPALGSAGCASPRIPRRTREDLRDAPHGQRSVQQLNHAVFGSARGRNATPLTFPLPAPA